MDNAIVVDVVVGEGVEVVVAGDDVLEINTVDVVVGAASPPAHAASSKPNMGTKIRLRFTVGS